MKKYTNILVLLLILVFFIVPVLIAQIAQPEGRHLRGVALEDTQYTEINFRNSVQQIELGGMLFIPSGGGAFPAVVVIHGSGTSVRRNRWYLTLTQYLQENGVIVLLPDKRGSEKSSGDWRSADFEDLATDTMAAIRYLQDQDKVAISEIGVVGMSQGGWISPIVANQSSDVAFIVNLVSAAVTPQEQLLAGKTVATMAVESDFMSDAIKEKAIRVGNDMAGSFARAYAAGVNIAYGTDSGVSAHGTNAEEAVLMVENGMSEMDVLVSATINAADLIDMSDSIGTIEAGKFADIIAVDRSPLEDIAELLDVEFVMKGGTVYKD